jgi:hypothetical protein
MKESESGVLKIEESESELLSTYCTVLQTRQTHILLNTSLTIHSADLHISYTRMRITAVPPRGLEVFL